MTTLEKLERKGYDNLQTCPYNPTHQVIASRMQFHITKCRLNYKESEYVKCPFNAIHHVPKIELNHHTQNCEDRIHFERYKICIVPDSANHIKEEQENEKPQEVVHYGMDDGEECWDDEKAEPYNPAEYAKNALIFRKTRGFNRKQKLKFRMEEAERLRKLKEQLYGQIKHEDEEEDERVKRRIKTELGNKKRKVKRESFSSFTTSSDSSSSDDEETIVKKEPKEEIPEEENMSVKTETESENSEVDDQAEDGECSDLEDGEIKDAKKKKRPKTTQIKQENVQPNVPKKVKLENGDEMKEEGECSSSDDE